MGRGRLQAARRAGSALYIKRLVGMPNEVIRIDGGDLWVQGRDQPAGFERLHRSLDHQQAMQWTVYDDSHRAGRGFRQSDPALESCGTGGARTRQSVVPAGQGNLHARKRTRPPIGQELRYHHVIPGPARNGKRSAPASHCRTPPVSTLITDFYSYNTDTFRPMTSPTCRMAARAWFSAALGRRLTDALVAFEPARADAGTFRLELIKAGVSQRCEIDLKTGAARLFRGDVPLGDAVPTEITRAGTYELAFANVDGRVTLWVDGRLPFGAGATFDSRLAPEGPTAADLEPARIAAKSASIEVDQLILRRDVYYTLEPAESDYSNLDGSARTEPSALLELLSDAAQFPKLTRYPARDFPVGPGRYLMLGDNSPWSRDARAWGSSDQIDPDLPGQGWDSSGRQSWEVPEALLIGKAFCVYWPHPKQVWPRLRFTADTRLPILPYIERMRLIR